MEDEPSSNSNDQDDGPSAAAVAAAKAASAKAHRMRGLLNRKKKSIHSRHQNGGRQKNTSYDFDAARAQMGNATANAQQLNVFISPHIPSLTEKELKRKGIALEMKIKNSRQP